jgi:hypothetical protein
MSFLVISLLLVHGKRHILNCSETTPGGIPWSGGNTVNFILNSTPSPCNYHRNQLDHPKSVYPIATTITDAAHRII